MSKKDLDEGTLILDKKQPPHKVKMQMVSAVEDVEETPSDKLYFDIHGLVTTDEKKAVTKKLTNKNGTRYFIKWGQEGPDSGRPLDPYGIYFMPGDETKRIYVFKETKKNVYDHYIAFLKAKSRSCYAEVERAMFDAH